jgi:hypothetical protein
MRLAMLALAVLAAAPVWAGEPRARLDLSVAPVPPADRGRPLVYTPPRAPLAGCAAWLPCGTRLYGEVDKYGAVAVEIPAMRW